MVTAWNSSLRPGERRQGTVELASRSPWAVIGAGGGQPPDPELSASGHGQGGGAQQRRACLWVDPALGEAGQGAAGPAGPRRPPSAAGAPRPCRRSPPRMGWSRSLSHARPPRSSPAPGPRSPLPAGAPPAAKPRPRPEPTASATYPARHLHPRGEGEARKK